MKKTIFILSAALAAAGLTSCNKTEPAHIEKGLQKGEIALANGVASSKGYIDGTTFYEVSVEQLHDDSRVDTPREMRVSAFLTPAEGNGSAGNYFESPGQVFAEDGGVWRHNPPL